MKQIEPLSVLIVAGETSGEEHGAGLMAALKRRNPGRTWRFFGSGGPRMAEMGAELFVDVKQLAAIGTWDAMSNWKTYWTLFRTILREVRRRRPKVAVLIDFPDFNLRLAGRLKRLGIPVCYFISPQVWAWKSYRVKQIRRSVDLMLVIFPFEEEVYRKQGIRAVYIGNPTVARLAWRHSGTDLQKSVPDKPVVALLPGSRRHEVERILPVQLDAASFIDRHLAARFWILRADGINRAAVEKVWAQWELQRNRKLDLEIRDGGVGKLLPQADCAIVKSGTSTLEAMLLQVPFVMVYRISPISWLLARPLVRTRRFCLANWVAGKEIVPEFVQNQATGESIGLYVLGLLQDPERRERMRRELELAAKSLGQQDAYREGAERIIKAFIEDGMAA